MEKKKKKVMKFLWWLNRPRDYYTEKEKQVIIGVRANTPQNCSCMCRGNVPREFGVTRQEVKSSLNALDDLDSQEEWLYNVSMLKNLDLKYCDPWGFD
jgi:hypothetical protein